MYHWDRNISGRLQRVSTPIEQGCEVSVHNEQMDPLPEEQQSQQGAPINPIAYRSMRDYIHPPRVSAPSYIIPPTDDVVVRSYLMPLLPTFHGMENENPYTHIWEFEDVTPPIPVRPDWRIRTGFGVRNHILGLFFFFFFQS